MIIYQFYRMYIATNHLSLIQELYFLIKMIHYQILNLYSILIFNQYSNMEINHYPSLTNSYRTLIKSIVFLYIFLDHTYSKHIQSVLTQATNSITKQTYNNIIKPYSIRNMNGPSIHQNDIYIGKVQQRQHSQILNAGQFGAQLKPRNIKILTYFPQDDLDGIPDGIIRGVDVIRLRKNYQIASKYYSSVLKVYPFPKATDTVFKGNCGTIPIPQQIQTSGFDVQKVDSVMLATIYSDPNVATVRTVAFAGPCWFMRRPVISQINYRAQLVAKQLQNSTNFQFHKLVGVTMHEMGHIFGLIYWTFEESWKTLQGKPATRFYVDSISQDKLPLNRVLANNPVANSTKKLVILPLIKSYVNSLFDCKDGLETGALLANDRNHWDSKVWTRQMMSPEIGVLDMRMTPLTLLLFKSTGWYADVEVQQYSWQYPRAKKQSCNFMRGSDTVYRGINKCQYGINGYQCDIAHNYGGPCLENGEVEVVQFCQSDDPKTRCFQSGTAVRCLQSQCVSAQKIKITNGSHTAYCEKGGNTIFQINGFLFSCPGDYQSFCGAQTCQNWCNFGGICINGVCNYAECNNFIQGCQSCQSKNSDKTIECTKCKTGLYLSGNKCLRQNCLIDGCFLCARNNQNQQICSKCFDDFVLANQKQCVAGLKNCNQITPNCIKCDINASNQNVCTKCANDLIYQSLEQRCVFPACQQVISNCQSCHDLNNDLFLSCSSCQGDWKLDQNQNKCVAPSCTAIVSFCQTCQMNNNDRLQCSKCQGDLKLFSNSCVQPVCQIALCKKCQLNLNKMQYCSSCQSFLVYNSTAKACQTPPCSQKIPGCDLCYIQNTIFQLRLVCSKCQSNLQLINNSCIKQELVKQECKITNCKTCGFDYQFKQTCQTCVQPYISSFNKRQCTLDCSKIRFCRICSIVNGQLICNACHGDFVIDSSKKACKQPDLRLCSSLIPGCLSCQFSTILRCTKCANGRALSIDKKACI